MGGILSKRSSSSVVDFTKPIDPISYYELFYEWSDSCVDLMTEIFAQFLPRTEQAAMILYKAIKLVTTMFNVSAVAGMACFRLENLCGENSPIVPSSIQRGMVNAAKYVLVVSGQAEIELQMAGEIHKEINRELKTQLDSGYDGHTELFSCWNLMLLNFIQALLVWMKFQNHLLKRVIGKVEEKETGGGDGGTLVEACDCTENVKTEMMKRFTVEVGKFMIEMRKVISDNRGNYISYFLNMYFS